MARVARDGAGGDFSGDNGVKWHAARAGSAAGRLTIAALVALLGFGASALAQSGPNRFVLSALLGYLPGAAAYLLMSGSVIAGATSSLLARHASDTDAGAGTVLALVVGASAAVVGGAVTLLRGGAENESARELLLALVLGATVVAWLVTNLAFALHYAHLHYQSLDPRAETGAGEDATSARGGFSFPGTARPDGMDFAYLAFTVGMTFQVSDVQVIARGCRRAVLGHGLLSFAYNTLIVAMVVNVALGQLQRVSTIGR